VATSRPSIGRYETLLRELTECQNRLANGKGDPLAIAEYAITSVIEFLQADRAVMDSGITNPLLVTLNALHFPFMTPASRRLHSRPSSKALLAGAG
jgi:hypothetical protein